MTTTFYLGKPGTMVGLPDPLPGASNPATRTSMARSTIGGGRVVSFTPGPPRRTWDMQWQHLDPDQAASLEGFFVGAYGQGPFALIDSARRNLLSANVSTATSSDASASGFTVDPTEAVTSTVDTYLRGPRALRWTLPATVTSGVLTVDPPGGLVGVPAPTGLPWTWSGSLYAVGTAPSVTVTPVLSWRRPDGSELSITSGTPVVVAGAWSTFSVSAAAPPAGAVAFVAQLRVTPGVLTAAVGGVGAPTVWPSPAPRRPTVVSVTTAAGVTFSSLGGRRPLVGTAVLERAPVSTTDVLLDQPQLDMFATARAWVPGTGVPLVSIVANPSSYPVFTPYRATSLQLVEVG